MAAGPATTLLKPLTKLLIVAACLHATRGCGYEATPSCCSTIAAADNNNVPSSRKTRLPPPPTEVLEALQPSETTPVPAVSANQAPQGPTRCLR